MHFIPLLLLFIKLSLINAESENETGANSSITRSEREAPASNTLLTDPLCPNLRSLCSNLKPGSSDIYVLECIETFQTSMMDSISEECQHLIWSRTKDLMDDKNVINLLEKTCTKDKDLEQINQCKRTSNDVSVKSLSGRFLACILDNRDTIRSPPCRGQIQRIESVAFSDFRLIGFFVQDCDDDIQKTGCGRLQASRSSKLSQGETLACLQNYIDKLNANCKRGILHLSELQAENIKFDRQLFLLCNGDAMHFCPEMRPGSGMVFKCLMRFKNDQKMSKQCQDQLERRDKLISHDFKISRGLARACKEDIKQNHCRRGVSDDKDVRLAQILLCLETIQKNSTRLQPECIQEMQDHRKMLMEDYNLSPEIITDCSDDIRRFCQNLNGPNTLHCLMEHSRPRRKKDRRVTAQCQRAVEQLIKISDVGEDWRVDPVLRQACKPVVDIACRDTEGGDARVMSCLMEKLGTNYMTEDCELALLQIQYFIARDFKLDPQLYRNCKEDAIKFCHAKASWSDLDQTQMDPERGPLVLPCLHRYAYHPEKEMQLSQECFQEVKRVMRQRAISVDLIPEVEDKCIDDLSVNCFDKTGKGEEMQCLQDNLEKLDKDCKEAVISFTEEQGAHIELNPIIMAVCGEAMEKYCESILKTGKDEGDVMECLISHKNEADLRQNVKCRAGIEHFQIISLKNFHFTYKFKEACRPHVTRFCPNQNTKFEVVSCLSEVMRNDTIRGSRHSIPKECRQQVRSQLYQQRENVDFDPKLKANCKEDIQKFCVGVEHGSGQVLECLVTHHGKLSEKCTHIIFQIKKSELTDSATDYTLMNVCKGMLKQYCADIDASKALHCLKIHREEPLFDNHCHMVVVNRMIEQNLDFRFNPDLQQACSKNIAQFCTKIVANAKPNEELNGKVINCLKQKFRDGKLVPKCEKQMTEILHEQALNYKLNPLLMSLCKDEIKVLCLEKQDNQENEEIDEDEDNGEIEECLKKNFLENRIITKECKVEVATLIQEAKADIHVDPLLQKACTVDLLKYCSHVQSGNGRQLKCLQIILEDESKSKALEDDCKQKLQQRMEMFKNADKFVQPPESLQELYAQMVTSPAKRYFAIILLTFIGIIFIVGLMFGRITRKHTVLKNK